MPLAHDWWKDPIFTATVVLAVFLHLVILTLQFAMPQENDAAVKEIAVTLRPSDKKIENVEQSIQAESSLGYKTITVTDLQKKILCYGNKTVVFD